MRWSEGDTVKFVEFYREHECLWNVAKPVYRNNQMRLTAMEKIVEHMGMEDFTVADARAKIKNLRNTYSQELQKIEKSIKSGMGGDDVYTPSMKWFKIMDAFMRKTKEKRVTKSNMDYQPGHGSQDDNSEADPQTNEETVRTQLSQDPQSQNDDITNQRHNTFTQLGTPQDTKPSTPRISSSGKKRRFQDLSAAVTELRQVSETVSKAPEEDEFDTFGRYLALSLKKMPVHLALQCENELQATVNRYRTMALTPIHIVATSPFSTSCSPTPSTYGLHETSSSSNYPLQQPSPQTFSPNVPSSNENVYEQDCLNRLVAEAIEKN